MKAEQRKELETNTLADKMGQAVQRLKHSPRRTFMIYFVIAVAILGAVWYGTRWWMQSKVETSMQWVRLYDGSGDQLEALAQSEETRNTHAGKAARLQLAWMAYWDFGIKMAGSDRQRAMVQLKKAVKEYSDLVDDCKDDPVFEPQALLGRAVAQESRAAEDRKHLIEAKAFYKELAEHPKYDKSAEAKFAQDRLKILDSDAGNRDLSATYKVIQDLLDIPPPMPAQPQFNPHQGVPGFPKEIK